MKKLILLALAIFAVACSKETESKFSLTKTIPADTEVFITSKDLKRSILEIKSNSFIKGNSFPLKQRISNQLDFIKNLDLKDPTGISFTGLQNETFIFTLTTKMDSALVQLDSVSNKSVQTFKENGTSFQKLEIENNSFFLLEKGNTAVISNSKQKILDIANGEKLLKSDSFHKAFKASDPDKLSVFVRHLGSEKLAGFIGKFGFPNFKNFAEWSVLDLDLTNSTIKGNGISLTEKTGSHLKSFTGTDPNPIESSKICPEDFLGMYSISFSSFRNLHTNLKNVSGDTTSTSYPKILDHTREISLIQLKTGHSLILNANEIEVAKEQLTGNNTIIDTFRGAPIIELETPFGLDGPFSNLMETENNRFYTIIDHFIVFSNKIEVLQNIIASYQNADIIADKSYFSDLMTSLSSESSMFFIARLPEFLDNTTELKFRKNSLAALQLINEGDFAHIHGVFSNSENAATASNGVEQMASFKLDDPLLTDPIFFRNHRTDQMDIAVQDENNVLRLISNKGNIFWKEQLDSKITSPIYQVDLFKNGNKQLAFSTGYHMEVLDRNGNKVDGFPIKFNNPLTQPLSVFDYDNNRTYRFVLTQNKKVYMVGPKGKAIKGFGFEGGNSDIIMAPKHIRLGTKDYILVAEETGKLNILSRQGNIRVPVTQDIEFSENEWYGYKGQFVTTAPQNDLIKISQQGQVTTESKELAENNRLAANDDHLVYLNENILNIDGKDIDLDFGLYTDPQLFQFQKRSLIALTDTQTQKVYVFDQNGELLDGFPVYGTSKVDIANADLDSRLELVVKGEANEILLYKL